MTRKRIGGGLAPGSGDQPAVAGVGPLLGLVVRVARPDDDLGPVGGAVGLTATCTLPLLVLRVAPTLMAQESGGVGKRRTRYPLFGVVVAVPPKFVAVSLPSLHVAVQLQVPARLAPAAVMPTVIMPTASNPVKIAQTTARPDLSIINCLSALARSP